MVDVVSCRVLLDRIQFTLIHGPNTPGAYAVLLFIASDFASVIGHIHNWLLFLLRLCVVFLSGVTVGSY